MKVKLSDNLIATYPQSGAQQLIASQTLTTAQVSVTFSNIPLRYIHRRLVIQCSSTGSFPYGNIFFNGDLGTNYNWSWIYWQNTAQAAGATADSGAAIFNCGLNSGAFAINDVMIYNYTSGQAKLMVNPAYDAQQNTTDSIGGSWSGTAAITSIELTPNGGNFLVGSTFLLYGEQ